jgi:hypothetical protein
MSQQSKGLYYRALKAEGATFPKHYREYTVDELKAAYDELRLERPDLPAAPVEATPEQVGMSGPPAPASGPRIQIPRGPKDPNEMAGQRTNTKDPDDPIRVDDEGLVWFQEEVRKPAYPKPRGRRVLRYTDTGTKQVTIKTGERGEYTETFEVAGDGAPQQSEVKVTLPSFQVGIYKDPRYPWKVHVYNENRGFDLYEIQAYYGGAELVPAEVKRIYVENILCYDMRTVIRAVQTEARQLALAQERR